MRQEAVCLPKNLGMKEIVLFPIAIELSSRLERLVKRANSIQRKAGLALDFANVDLLEKVIHGPNARIKPNRNVKASEPTRWQLRQV